MKSDKKIVWLGISMQKDASKAFDIEFLSGEILQKVQDDLPDFEHHFDNLVDFAPLDENGKIRYPNAREIMNGKTGLIKRLEQVDPQSIVALGGLVTKNLAKILEADLNFPKNFIYQKYMARWPIIPAHHPAYIGVYKRKDIDKYAKGIQEAIKSVIESKDGD